MDLVPGRLLARADLDRRVGVERIAHVVAFGFG